MNTHTHTRTRKLDKGSLSYANPTQFPFASRHFHTLRRDCLLQLQAEQLQEQEKEGDQKQARAFMQMLERMDVSKIGPIEAFIMKPELAAMKNYRHPDRQEPEHKEPEEKKDAPSAPTVEQIKAACRRKFQEERNTAKDEAEKKLMSKIRFLNTTWQEAPWEDEHVKVEFMFYDPWYADDYQATGVAAIQFRQLIDAVSRPGTVKNYSCRANVIAPCLTGGNTHWRPEPAPTTPSGATRGARATTTRTCTKCMSDSTSTSAASIKSITLTNSKQNSPTATVTMSTM